MANWVICPFIDNWAMTENAIADALDQDIGDIQVLAIAQGYSDETRRLAETFAEGKPNLHFWWFSPALMSLSAVWNRALSMVWLTGATEALVINNDTRLKPNTYMRLRVELVGGAALFVSGVGVIEDQFKGSAPTANDSRGGPDFSCFCISRECHEKFPFDEAFIPCYTEDCSLHREIMLAGEGQRIYSIDVPYWHVDGGSGTLKSMNPERRATVERAIELGSRAHYARKWGGPVGAEKFAAPFDGIEVTGITNPELFDRVRQGWQKK